MEDRSEPGPLGLEGIRRLAYRSVVPVLPLALLLALLIRRYPRPLDPPMMGSVPAALVSLGLVLSIGALAAVEGGVLPGPISLDDRGVVFGRGRWPRWRWSELIGPLATPQHGVVQVFRRTQRGLGIPVGWMTSGQARSLLADPRFDPTGCPPWVWESLGIPMVPPSERPSAVASIPAPAERQPWTEYTVHPLRALDGRTAEFRVREGISWRRRRRVLFWFTAPLLTSAIALLALAATDQPGVSIALVGACTLGFYGLFAGLRREAAPPSRLAIEPGGVRLGRAGPRGLSQTLFVPWQELRVLGARFHGPLRVFLNWDTGDRISGATHIRLSPAVQALLEGFPDPQPSAVRGSAALIAMGFAPAAVPGASGFVRSSKSGSLSAPSLVSARREPMPAADAAVVASPGPPGEEGDGKPEVASTCLVGRELAVSRGSP